MTRKALLLSQIVHHCAFFSKLGLLAASKVWTLAPTWFGNNQAAINNMLVTRSFHSADCDTDHSLVCSNARLWPKKIQQCKLESCPHINITRAAHTHLRTGFCIKETALKNSASTTIEERCQYLRDNIHDTATAFLGNKERNSQDWFETHLLELEAVIAAKQEALIHYKKISSKTGINRWKGGPNTTRTCILKRT